MLLDTGEFYSQLTMRKILNDDMVDKIFLFANQFNKLELTDMEIAILCAARLTSSGIKFCECIYGNISFLGSLATQKWGYL